MLKSDLALEYKVVKNLKDVIAACEEAKDFQTREILEKILADTGENHTYWLEKQLGLINKIGLQNYLQSQMGDEHPADWITAHLRRRLKQPIYRQYRTLQIFNDIISALIAKPALSRRPDHISNHGVGWACLRSAPGFLNTEHFKFPHTFNYAIDNHSHFY